ncbi:MAG: hypothetical protein LAT76_04460 [Schleiferiaceae bacterium]|nr:hypothetical protein [Schleiferiaceae bacterium]
MRIPLIKHTVQFMEAHDEDWVTEAIELLEHMADAPGIKDEELEVLGEFVSNFYGALEVMKDIKSGTTQKDALNGFMKRVMGSIN